MLLLPLEFITMILLTNGCGSGPWGTDWNKKYHAVEITTNPKTVKINIFYFYPFLYLN